MSRAALRLTGLVALVCSLVLLPGGVQAQQLDGFKIPPHGKKGVFSPGLIRGYGENQVIPFKANIDPTDLQEAALRAAAEGSASQYLVTVMIPTHSDHAPPRPSEANGMSECLFGVLVGGEYPHAASVPNYKDLPAAEAPAQDLLGGGGAFHFGVVEYQPDSRSWEGNPQKAIGVINAVVNRFGLGHPVFPNGVTGLIHDIHFDITNPPAAKGKKDPPPLAATIQFGARLADSGLPAIIPGGNGSFPGACSFHPGPGLLHVAYEVSHPTGRATVPIVCTPGGGEEQHLIQITGMKWNDIALDHCCDPGDPALAGIIIELRNGSCTGEVLDSDTTDALGCFYLMTVVPDGGDCTFVVMEQGGGPACPGGMPLWVQTTPQCDNCGNPILCDFFPAGTGMYTECLTNVKGDVTLTGRDFGNIPPQQITVTGTKWCDHDVDHSFDAGDQVLPGVVVELRDASCLGTVLDCDVTDASGEYTLVLDVEYATSVSFVVVENSSGPGEPLDPVNAWVQTTPRTDCLCNPILAHWFAVGTGVYCESFVDVRSDLLLADRDFGNLRLMFGDVGERTPGFWCSQVHVERDQQGGSEPCHDLIVAHSGSVEARVNSAIAGWKTSFCLGGFNETIFDPYDADTNGHFDLDEAAQILCPQEGPAEHHQFERHLLALLLNVTDCPTVGIPCGNVGSPACLGQEIFLGGQFTTVGAALSAACAGTIDYNDLADINENLVTVLIRDCGP